MRYAFSAKAVLCCVAIGLLSVPVWAQSASNRSLLRSRGGTLSIAEGGDILYGLELPASLRLPADDLVLRAMIQPWAVHGLNCAGFSVWHLVDDGAFVSPDGRSCTPQAAQQFDRFTRFTTNHGFSTVVSLFSAERRRWLASPEAYEQAVQTIARLLPDKHRVVLVVGDLFGTTPWSPECPGRLDDPERALSLCRAMLKARPDAVVGIPADILPSPAGDNPRPLFYAASRVEALAQLVAHQQGQPATGDWKPHTAAVPVDQFLCRRTITGDAEAAIASFAGEIERRSVAIESQPAVPACGENNPAADALAVNQLTPQEREEGWVSLFDGRSLDGWTTLLPTWGRWCVADGVITCQRGVPPHPWLRSRKRYGSFVLRLECKLEAGGNSGVFLWAPLDARASSMGFEVQLMSGQYDKLDSFNTTGAIYGVQPPSEDASRSPDQWNELEITCRGSKIMVRLNGRVVQDFDADDVPIMKTRLRHGYIGLQDHENVVMFRRIRIRDLSSNP